MRTFSNRPSRRRGNTPHTAVPFAIANPSFQAELFTDTMTHDPALNTIQYNNNNNNNDNDNTIPKTIFNNNDDHNNNNNNENNENNNENNDENNNNNNNDDNNNNDENIELSGNNDNVDSLQNNSNTRNKHNFDNKHNTLSRTTSMPSNFKYDIDSSRNSNNHEDNDRSSITTDEYAWSEISAWETDSLDYYNTRRLYDIRRLYDSVPNLNDNVPDSVPNLNDSVPDFPPPTIPWRTVWIPESELTMSTGQDYEDIATQEEPGYFSPIKTTELPPRHSTLDMDLPANRPLQPHEHRRDCPKYRSLPLVSRIPKLEYQTCMIHNLVIACISCFA